MKVALALAVCIAAGVAFADLVDCAPNPGPVTPATLVEYTAALKVCRDQVKAADAGFVADIACFQAETAKFCALDGGVWSGAQAGVCDSGVLESVTGGN